MKLLSVNDYIDSFSTDSFAKLRIKDGDEKRALNGGYHLAIGDAVSYKSGRISLDNGSVTIHPNETIIFKSQEYFHVPENHCGFAVNRVWECVRQLRIDTTFIDPGYQGKLHIIVTNYGDNLQTLSVKNPILKIVMFVLDEPIGKAAISTNRNDIDMYLNTVVDNINENKELDSDIKKSTKIRTWFFGLALFFTIALAFGWHLFQILTLDQFLKIVGPLSSFVMSVTIAPIVAYFALKREDNE